MADELRDAWTRCKLALELMPEVERPVARQVLYDSLRGPLYLLREEPGGPEIDDALYALAFGETRPTD